MEEKNIQTNMARIFTLKTAVGETGRVCVRYPCAEYMVL